MIEDLKRSLQARWPVTYERTLKWKDSVLRNKAHLQRQRDMRDRMSFYGTFLEEGDLCFDVGANLGNRVEAFLGLKAQVVAFDPQPFCAEYLKRTFGHRIEVVSKAMGSVPGHQTMMISDSHTLSSLSSEYVERVKQTRFKHASWNQKIQVEVTTLDEAIEAYGRPVFLKVDVEGYESEVFKGLRSAIPFISFEYNTPEFNQVVLDCLDIISQIDSNYEFNYSIGESMSWALDEWKDSSSFRTLSQSGEFIDSGFGDVYARLPQALSKNV